MFDHLCALDRRPVAKTAKGRASHQKNIIDAIIRIIEDPNNSSGLLTEALIAGDLSDAVLRPLATDEISKRVEPWRQHMSGIILRQAEAQNASRIEACLERLAGLGLEPNRNVMRHHALGDVGLLHVALMNSGCPTQVVYKLLEIGCDPDVRLHNRPDEETRSDANRAFQRNNHTVSEFATAQGRADCVLVIASWQARKRAEAALQAIDLAASPFVHRPTAGGA